MTNEDYNHAYAFALGYYDARVEGVMSRWERIAIYLQKRYLCRYPNLSKYEQLMTVNFGRYGRAHRGDKPC